MVTVSDDDFLMRVERHEETFGAGDILNCEVNYPALKSET